LEFQSRKVQGFPKRGEFTETLFPVITSPIVIVQFLLSPPPGVESLCRLLPARGKRCQQKPVGYYAQTAGSKSLRAIAAGLEERGIPTARGGKWSAIQVARLLENAGLQPRPFEDVSVVAA